MTMRPTRGTRLPEDGAYWDGLAARAVRAAYSDSFARSGRQPWWRALSEASFALAASAVLALIGGSLLPGPQSVARGETHALTVTLAPDDPLLGSLLGTDAEPPPSALLQLMAMREAQR